MRTLVLYGECPEQYSQNGDDCQAFDLSLPCFSGPEWLEPDMEHVIQLSWGATVSTDLGKSTGGSYSRCFYKDSEDEEDVNGTYVYEDRSNQNDDLSVSISYQKQGETETFTLAGHNGFVVKQVDGEVTVTQYGVDFLSGTVTGPEDNKQVATVIDRGQLYTRSTSDGKVTRVKREVDVGGGTMVELGSTYWKYDEDGRRTRVTVVDHGTDGMKRYLTTLYCYDASGRLTTVVGPEGVKRYLVEGSHPDYGVLVEDPGGACTLDDTTTVTESALQDYASAIYTYDGNDRVVSATGDGCCGGGGGKTLYRYGGEFSGSYYNTAVTYRRTQYVDSTGSENRTGARVVEFLNSFGQVVYRVTQQMDYSASPRPDIEQVWITHYVYYDDEDYRKGYLKEVRFPSACVNYTTSEVDVTDDDKFNGEWVSSVTADNNGSAGLVRLYSYDSNSNLEWEKIRQGTKSQSAGGNTEYYVRKYTYTSVTYGGYTTYRVASETRYPVETDNADHADKQVTSYSYTYYKDGEDDTHVAKTKTVTHPTVTTACNGSNSATTVVYHYEHDTTNDLYWNDWTEREDGSYSYRELGTDPEDFGEVVKEIEDVDTDAVGAPTLPSGWDAKTDGLNLTTTYGYYDGDGSNTPNYGQLKSTTFPGGRKIVYATSRQKTTHGSGATLKETTTSIVSFGTPHMDGDDDYDYAPLGILVTDLAGRTVIAAAGDSSDDEDGDMVNDLSSSWTTGSTDLDTLEDYFSGTLCRASVTEYDGVTGGPVQVDRYHDIPTDGNGTLGTNFYRTVYQYDDLGRQEYAIQVVSGTDPTTTGVASSCVEQVTMTVYDQLGRTKEKHAGVSGTDHAMGSDYDAYPTLRKLSEVFHDESTPGSGTEGIGNGNVTCEKQYYDSSNSYATLHTYDWRDRLVQSRQPGDVAAKLTLDNLDRVTVTEIYHDSDTDWTVDSSELGEMRESKYDQKSQVYQRIEYNVSNGSYSSSNSDRMVANLWYDSRGRGIKSESANDLFRKSEYDDAGRLTARYVCYDTDETAYDDADDVTGDTVVEQTRRCYDDSGDVWLVRRFKRKDNASGTGALTTTTARVTYTASWYDDLGRLTATVDYGTNEGGDDLDGKTDDFDPETEGTQDYDSGHPSPNTSEKYAVTEFYYDDNGRLYETRDNKNVKTRAEFDDIDRVTGSVFNYVDGSVGNSEYGSDVTVQYTYNGAGQVTRLRAKSPNGSGVDNEDTYYLYNDSVNASLATEIVYPDSTSTLSADSRTVSSGTDHVTMACDYMGRQTTGTDQRGVEHSYAYDGDRRLKYDSFSNASPPSGVDTAIRRIGFTYDDFGRTTKVTSYDDPDDGEGNVENEVKHTYYDSGTASTYYAWGGLTKSEQDHAGAVGGGEPAVQYLYETGADGASSGGDNAAEYVRLDKVTYPGGQGSCRDVYYNYGTTPLARLSDVSADSSGSTTKWIDYDTFLGLSRGTQTCYGVDGTHSLNLYHGESGSYPGLDRFGRIVDHKWEDSGSNTKDRFKYGYDRSSNRQWREVYMTGVDGKDEYYGYDGLSRLTDLDRGDLTGSPYSGIETSDDVLGVEWTLDASGNWKEYQVDANADDDYADAGDLDQDREHNLVNEIYDASDAITQAAGQAAWLDPVYDAVGNMTFCARPGDEATASEALHLVYDAWNRLVKAYQDDGATQGTLETSGENPDTLLAEYDYDGLGRRIRKVVDPDGNDITYDYYYNNLWQVLEVRKDSDTDPLEQYVWDTRRYIDGCAVRFRDGNTDGDLSDTGDDTDNTLYYMTDANHNVTALVKMGASSQHGVTERYTYDAYGEVTVLNGETISGTEYDRDGTVTEWTEDAAGASDWDNEILFAGYRYDPETGLYHVRRRSYNPTMGRWAQRDPIGYTDGLSMYQYAASNSPRYADSLGTMSGSTARNLLDHFLAYLDARERPLPIAADNSDANCARYMMKKLFDAKRIHAIGTIGWSAIFSTIGAVPKSLLAKLSVQAIERLVNTIRERNQGGTVDESEILEEVKKTFDNMTPSEWDIVTKLIKNIINNMLGNYVGDVRVLGARYRSPWKDTGVNIDCVFVLEAETVPKGIFGILGEDIKKWKVSATCKYTCVPNRWVKCHCGCCRILTVTASGNGYEDNEYGDDIFLNVTSGPTFEFKRCPK